MGIGCEGVPLDIQRSLFFHLAQDAPCNQEKEPKDATQGYGSGQDRDPKARLVGMGKTDPDKDEGNKAQIGG